MKERTGSDWEQKLIKNSITFFYKQCFISELLVIYLMCTINLFYTALAIKKKSYLNAVSVSIQLNANKNKLKMRNLRKILQSTAFFYSRLIFRTCPSSTTRTSYQTRDYRGSIQIMQWSTVPDYCCHLSLAALPEASPLSMNALAISTLYYSLSFTLT